MTLAVPEHHNPGSSTRSGPLSSKPQRAHSRRRAPPSAYKEARNTRLFGINPALPLVPGQLRQCGSSPTLRHDASNNKGRSRKVRSFSSSSTASESKSFRIRLRLRAQMIARQLAISTDEVKQSLAQIRIDSVCRSKQNTERALKGVLLAKANLEATLDDMRRELQDTRCQLEECKREKESLTIENSMLVEELADLKKEAIRFKLSSNTIRPRTISEGPHSPPKLSPSHKIRAQRSREGLLDVPVPFQRLTPIPQSPMIFDDEQGSCTSGPPEPIVPLFAGHTSFLTELEGHSLVTEVMPRHRKLSTNSLLVDAEDTQSMVPPLPLLRRASSYSTISRNSSIDEGTVGPTFPPLPPVPERPRRRATVGAGQEVRRGPVVPLTISVARERTISAPSINKPLPPPPRIEIETDSLASARMRASSSCSSAPTIIPSARQPPIPIPPRNPNRPRSFIDQPIQRSSPPPRPRSVSSAGSLNPPETEPSESTSPVAAQLSPEAPLTPDAIPRPPRSPLRTSSLPLSG